LASEAPALLRKVGADREHSRTDDTASTGEKA
jgi:hypothetical protein